MLYVPDLAANLLSFYQMTHIGEAKRVTFTPNMVEIAEISSDQVIAIGYATHHERCTSFQNSSPLPMTKNFSHMPMMFPSYGMRGLIT